jgi:hypothetical protein
MVSSEGIKVGTGNALHLAGMGGDACLYWHCGGGKHRHSADSEYETVSGCCYCIIAPFLPCLLVEGEKPAWKWGDKK